MNEQDWQTFFYKVAQKSYKNKSKELTGEPLHNLLCRFRSYFECIKLNLTTLNEALNQAQLRFGFDHLNITFIIFKGKQELIGTL